MEFNELSATELIEAISGLSGVILQIHKDFRPIFVTKDYARLYGFDSTEQFLKLGSIMDLIPEDARDLAIKRYQQIIRTGMGDTLTLKTQRVDGTGIWVRIQDRRLKYGDDGYCVMTVLIDITDEVELKQKYEEIAAAEHEARSELERVQGLTIEREKQSALTQLLAGVSHQLNTPLGNIRTSSTTVEKILNETLVKLRDKSLRESDLVNAMSEALEAMHVIDKSVVKANRLIKNVKFMVSDQTEADPVRFRFQPIINDAVRLFSENDNGISLDLDIQIDPDLHAYANPNTWMQVMSVFCENAIQHGFYGRSHGTLRIDSAFEDGRFILVFSDNGHGVDPETANRIFEAFYSSTMGSRHGLGLALVYSLVSRQLGGEIRLIEPRFGQGASFEIALPAEHYEIRT